MSKSADFNYSNLKLIDAIIKYQGKNNFVSFAETVHCLC